MDAQTIRIVDLDSPPEAEAFAGDTVVLKRGAVAAAVNTAQGRRPWWEVSTAWARRGYGWAQGVDWRLRAWPVAGLTEQERAWAALGYLGLPLILLAGVLLPGIGGLLLLILPLVVYLAWRGRSSYVAFHALQAFGLQLTATVGWAAVLVLGLAMLAGAIVLSGIASLLLVGIPFLLLFLALGVVFVGGMVIAPVGLLALSLLAAYRTFQGRNYRLPLLAGWIDGRPNLVPR